MTTAWFESAMLATLLALASTAAPAQPVTSTLEGLNHLGGRAALTVTDGSGREFRGRMIDASESRLCLQLRRESRCFDAPDVDSVRVRQKDSLANGALIGAAVGAGLTSLIFLDNECRGAPVCYAALAFYSGVGAGAGLIVDALIHKSRVVYSAPAATGPTVFVRPMGVSGVQVTLQF